jgi:hypothetical protein
MELLELPNRHKRSSGEIEFGRATDKTDILRFRELIRELDEAVLRHQLRSCIRMAIRQEVFDEKCDLKALDRSDRPRHCGICCDAGCNLSSGRGHHTTDRLERKYGVFKRGQFDSIGRPCGFVNHA